MTRLFTFLATVVATVLTAGVVFAEGGDYAAGASAPAFAYSAAFIMAVASGMGTFSQSRAATTALEGIARNPQAADKIQTPLILSLALMESLVLFAFVIAILIVFKF